MRGSATADPRLDAAFAAVPRERFLPAGQRRHARSDRPLPLGHGATCSQPSTVRAMLALLDVHPGHRVLDVGAGSGWTAALLGHLCAPGGEVVGVERVPEVLALGARQLAAFGAPAVLHRAEPGVLGWPRGAPYDRVLVSADAPVLPAALLAQLGEQGVLVGPVRGRMLRVRRRPDGPPLVEEHGRYRFVPLVS